MGDVARMSEVTNDRRAQWARAALKAFARQSGQSIDLPDGDSEVIGDLLCDLHHWADAHDVVWDEARWPGARCTTRLNASPRQPKR